MTREGRWWMPLALLTIGLALTSASEPTDVSPVGTNENRSSETLLSALQSLEVKLNDSSFCDLKLKNLWRHVVDLQVKLNGLQEKVFVLMNHMAVQQSLSPVIEECPPPFVNTSAGCFYKSTDKLKKWKDSRRVCGSLGGDLAHPRDISAFKRWIASGSGGFGFIFLGAHAPFDSQDQSPDFRWLDGRTVLSDQRHFTTPYKTSEDMNCILMDNHGPQNYKPKECESTFGRYYACEIKLRTR